MKTGNLEFERSGDTGLSQSQIGSLYTAPQIFKVFSHKFNFLMTTAEFVFYCDYFTCFGNHLAMSTVIKLANQRIVPSPMLFCVNTFSLDIFFFFPIQVCVQETFINIQCLIFSSLPKKIFQLIFMQIQTFLSIIDSLSPFE